MTDKMNNRFQQDEYDELERMYTQLNTQCHTFKGDQKREFDQIDKRYQQFRRDWQSNQSGQTQGQRVDRQAYDSLHRDMQRFSGGVMSEGLGARREPVGAGAEEEEEEEH